MSAAGPKKRAVGDLYRLRARISQARSEGQMRGRIRMRLGYQLSPARPIIDLGRRNMASLRWKSGLDVWVATP
jgi:hypothetical protein